MELISSKEIKKCVKKNIYEQLRRKQNESDTEIYVVRNKDDDIICVICGGKYKRYQRSTHIGRKKHIRALNEIYDNYKINKIL